MIDFHTHILPGLDDGAQDVEESLALLRICAETGIDTVVATPHCHLASQDEIPYFLECREESYNRLKDAISASGEKFPEIVLGAEVRIYNGFSQFENLDKLKIAGTDYILLEMPYEPWKYDIFDEIYYVTQIGFKPIMAHLDRFLDQKYLFNELYAMDLLYQINSCAFLDKPTRKMMLDLFKNQAIHIIGSDTHNLTDRKPDVAEAFEVIGKKFGQKYVSFLDKNSRRILENKPISHNYPPKINLLRKIML